MSSKAVAERSGWSGPSWRVKKAGRTTGWGCRATTSTSRKSQLPTQPASQAMLSQPTMLRFCAGGASSSHSSSMLPSSWYTPPCSSMDRTGARTRRRAGAWAGHLHAGCERNGPTALGQQPSGHPAHRPTLATAAPLRACGTRAARQKMSRAEETGGQHCSSRAAAKQGGEWEHQHVALACDRCRDPSCPGTAAGGRTLWRGASLPYHGSPQNQRTAWPSSGA